MFGMVVVGYGRDFQHDFLRQYSRNTPSLKNSLISQKLSRMENFGGTIPGFFPGVRAINAMHLAFYGSEVATISLSEETPAQFWQFTSKICGPPAAPSRYIQDVVFKSDLCDKSHPLILSVQCWSSVPCDKL